MAALDGVGTGGPNCRDNLGDLPVRGVHGAVSPASARATDEELRRICGALVLLREWAWGVEPNEPTARLGCIGGALQAFSSGRHADHLHGADNRPQTVDLVGLQSAIQFVRPLRLRTIHR